MDPVELTKSLVAFKTVTPPGDEEECARYLKDLLEDESLDSAEFELHRFQSGRANLIANFGPKGKGGLLLSGHMDVVPAADASSWRSPPFVGEIRGGRLYGRGTADMKGGLAAMACAISSTASGKKLKRGITYIATAGEEIGFDGLNALLGTGKLTDKVSATLGVVGEPTSLKTVRAHKGGVTLQISFDGQSAHASKPEFGVNAIQNCHLFLTQIDALREKLRKKKDTQLGSATATPTVIAGGSKSNVIPSLCTVTLDCRSIPSVSGDMIRKEVNAIIAGLSKKHAGFKAKVEVLYSTPTLALRRSDEIVRLAEEMTRSSSTVAPYGTEASVYTNAGVPTVVLGPGSVENIHIVDEYVAVSELRSAEAIYAKLIERVCL